ncbi:class I SAM-dependent methyltransferase [Virgibacillus dokdonensis]|uniref:Demethylmenaquinone methyltransferase n=1 Tax=Virgibacillus dokdonensis TaxID=302167 RepID=A0A2K9IW56_9BACI|nr:class I SAM-dependent methyltransferase [Virgibacillus dokdonensis]AUJ23957.1 Demethylmenaquinone methyltransferase [Virgibacillus dokdonensis]
MNDNQTNTIRKRYNRIAGVFGIMDNMIQETWRKDVTQQAEGKVLEIGIGTGKNLEYYPSHVEVTGIDFSPGMLKRAKEKANQLGRTFELLEMDAQNLAFPDNTFDTVITTCVFCSVPDPIKGLKEMKRVTKPTGKILMLEHMRSEHKLIGKLMDILNPIGLHIVGANINRKTIENIQHVGLKIAKEDLLMYDIFKKLVVSPNKNH